MVAADATPLVSIVWNGCNRLDAAKACIAGLAGQAYPNLELVVQAGNSTDGTFEFFQSAAARDRRILVLPTAAADSGAGLLKALRTCRGDYVGFWPIEGRLAPDALQIAVDEFALHPNVGAVCGAGFLVDGSDRDLAPVDIVTLLFTSYQPFLPAGFLRRRALQDCGLARDGWLTESIDVELCLRLASDFGLHTTSRRLVECARPLSVEDGLPKDAPSALEERTRVISRIFSVEGFFGPVETLYLESLANHLAMLWQRLTALGAPDAYLAVKNLRAVALRFHSLLRTDHRTLWSLHRLFCARSHNLGLLSTPLQKIFTRTRRLNERARIHFSYQIWNCTFRVGYWLKRKVVALTMPRSDFHPAAPTRAEMLADLYALAAARYESRGQIDLALEMWERARPPDDVARDSSAAQALLKLPEATDATIAAYQRTWVKRHVGGAPAPALQPAAPRPADRPGEGRKVRVGYHCAFMDSDTIRYMMRNVMAAHDRSRFTVFGYSPKPYPADLVASFDVRRDTSTAGRFAGPRDDDAPALSDDDFVALVRRDRIDVLVELTGFSPGNRFRAMSRRCAPVQVSFLNHTGSSQVPNVDCLITDEICTPSDGDVQAHYSERLWRLPGCFFSFDYRGSECPAPAEPPLARRGYPTFGCFGHGGKLNRELLGLWVQLLHRVPSAVLHLQNTQFANDATRRFIARQFERLGIPGERLLLVKGVERSALLDVYNQIDVSLDTWPYCGGNTVAEALWMGVPVVTLLGDRFSARYGASLLSAAGCDDLIAGTPEQYLDIAARLAGDLPRLRRLRHDLRRMSIEHGLGDSRQFAHRLENAYLDMLAASGRVAGPAGGALVTP